MATVKIEFKDLPDGKVSVVATPNLETMAKMKLSGEDITAAQGYAFKVMNLFNFVVKQEVEKRRKESPIIIPQS